ncbi:hypothetical protein AAE478_010380 [Parahypoxylon ruwenzoriense]
MELTGNALVFGGASGICKAVCMALAKAGVQGLLVADINFEAATETAIAAKAYATNPGFRAESVEVDVSVQDSVERATEEMVQIFGRIDYCVNGAAIVGLLSDIASSDLESFRKVIDINVQGSFLVLKSVTGAMISQEPLANDTSLPTRGVTRGSIVNLASVASFVALPQAIPYVTSKHAVLGLTRNAAFDNIKHNIRVNCVCPSWVDTPMVTRLTNESPPMHQQIMSQLPMGRMGLPEEIADVVMFLCSTRSSWVNGSAFTVDGAMTLGPYIPGFGVANAQ